MTYYDVYVARADDPAYTREDGDWDGNFPVALSPALYDRQCFDHIIGLIHNNEVPGKQTDWGCWVGIVNKVKILDIFKDVRDPEMTEFLKSLKGDQLYAVVALET